MLGVGIDWAEEFHLVALGSPGEGVIEVRRVEHRPEAVSALVERIAGLEADPAEVRVVLETRHGLLVEALVDAGYTVLPVNPELVSRRRGPARKKDDAEDARICCLLALDRHAGLRRLIPPGSSWPVRGRMQVWCWSPMPGTPRCCCVRVCQSPVLMWAPAGGSPFPVV